MVFKTISKIKYFLYSNSNTEIMLGVLSGRDVRKSLETRAVRCTSKVMTIVAGKKVALSAGVMEQTVSRHSQETA